MNGVPIEENYLTPEDFEEQLLTLIMKETQVYNPALPKSVGAEVLAGAGAGFCTQLRVSDICILYCV